MDYKKEYEAMVQRAREFHEAGNFLTKKQMEIVCPELAESEDERTRKEIVEFIRSQIEGGNSIGWDRWIAYLERQKERGPLTKEEEMTLQDIKLYLEDVGCPTKWKDLLHDIYILPYEKQKEQKPAEWSEDFDKEVESVHKRYPEVSFAKLTRIAHHFAKWADKYKSTEWSEEDERILKGIIGLVDHDQHYGVSNKDMIAWLKSLRPQPKVEWTDDDEAHLKWICSIIHGRVVHKELSLAEESELGKWMDKWLNHNPQPQWKPSKKLEALYKKVCECRPADQQLLQDLYFGLKKL